ncbi:hypothetical protein HN385_02425 [archaeon]|jgi:hypothetical protein|nr:hypothetical protein [archaeon]MBT3450773.1 hypothetical protein [archaeon]MBT6868814.1 hypothetical protein [archaeon]MBT7192965.1 hypothetical protein [archaeon]MBT7380931.1 hypothetical protein [archaeon]
MQNLKDFFDGLSYEVARLSMGDSYGILNGVIQDTEIPEKYSTVLDLAKGLVGALGGVGDEDSNDLMTQIQTYCTDKEDALGNRRSIKNREVNIIINQYNGTLDVIMPVKEDDLESNGLPNKLYESVEKVCTKLEAEYQCVCDHKIWEGYVLFSVPNVVDRSDLAKRIMDNAPKQLGGTNGDGRRIAYLRIADNFAFKYKGNSVNELQDLGSVVEIEPVGRSRNDLNEKNISQSYSSLPKKEKIRLRKEIKVLFENGIDKNVIRQTYSQVPIQAIAGVEAAMTLANKKKDQSS